LPRLAPRSLLIGLKFAQFSLGTKRCALKY
jgi:hypothetical protein